MYYTEVVREIWDSDNEDHKIEVKSDPDGFGCVQLVYYTILSDGDKGNGPRGNLICFPAMDPNQAIQVANAIIACANESKANEADKK